MKKVFSFIDRFLIPLFAFLIPFFLTFQNRDDRDLWYHLKSGEIFLKYGILHHDIFSFVTKGRELYPTEWLFQVLLYLYQQLFGFSAIGILVGVISGVEIFLVFILLRKFIKVSSPFALLLSLFYFARIGDTFFPRPFGIANIFLLLWLLLLWLYLKSKKNLLFLLPLLMCIWVNMHGSFIVGLYISGAYALVYCLWGSIQNHSENKRTALVLALWTSLSGLVTILPPLHFDPYKVLLLYQHYKGNAAYIIEWNPISSYNALIYVLMAGSVIIPTLILFRKKKNMWLFLGPLLPLLILPFLSQRHIIISFIPILTACAMIFCFIGEANLPKQSRLFVMALITVGLAACSIPFFQYYFQLRKAHLQELYPTQATVFIKTYNLQGNMFNGYNFGGYLLYHLYPQQKVFIDARADPYLCCEIGLLKSLSDASTDNQRIQILKEIFTTYNISYILLTRAPSEGPLQPLVAKISTYQIIYWDDISQIYVRKNSANKQLIKTLAPHYATPFDSTPFDKTHPQEALKEYQRMTSIADSAKSRNAMGVIDISLRDISDATKQFQKAIQVNPTFEPPYLNLANIYATEQKYSQAIDTLQHAISQQPTIAYPYLMLSRLYSTQGNIDQAKEILQEGLDTVPDQEKDALNKALESF